MFNLFKTKEKQVLESLNRNHELYKKNIFTFYSSLNPLYLKEYLFENADFFYSCLALKNSFSNNTLALNQTIAIESIVFTAKIAEHYFADYENLFFNRKDYFKHIFKRINDNSTCLFHIDTFFKMIEYNLYKRRYTSDNPNDLIDEYLYITDNLTVENKWNHIITDVLKRESRAFVDHFRTNHQQIYSRFTKNLYKENVEYISNKEIAVHYSNTGADSYFPDLDVYMIFSQLSENINSYLLQKLNINLDDIDTEYYLNDIPYPYQQSHSFDESLQARIFRTEIQRILNFQHDNSEPSIIKLKNETIDISPTSVITLLDTYSKNKNNMKHTMYLY